MVIIQKRVGQLCGNGTVSLNDCASLCAQAYALQFLQDSPIAQITPAMEAGVSDHVWSLDEIIQFLPEPTNSVLE